MSRPARRPAPVADSRAGDFWKPKAADEPRRFSDTSSILSSPPSAGVAKLPGEMTLIDSSTLIAACAGDTVKLFSVGNESGDPCVLTYSPSPGFQVNSIKWNHTNLIVASAGDDKTISLWHKKGQSLGKIPVSKGEVTDYIEESICSISFSNKTSRYLCSGGSSHMVRIWDLQRMRCIKWLSGHSDSVTGVMYNCKDEHLASISLDGNLIVYNLASGARAAELKDPNEQPLRALDYSRISRHSLVTAGDDGSVHLWDTTGRSPKISWPKQHSAPSTGVCFSPSNDKIIASAGLDKKLYTFDLGTRRSTYCIPFEAPFSSLTYSDGGNALAAGTSNGSIVIYDIRGKPRPFTVLRAYSSSEVVTSLCWQRSKPVTVNENNCSVDVALLGGTFEESVLMPDPLPSTSSLSANNLISSRPSLTGNSSASRSTLTHQNMSEENLVRTHLTPDVSLSKLQASQSKYNLKDDMDVFSPLADVQPITPSQGFQFEDHDEVRTDTLASTMKSTPYPFKKFPESNNIPHPISDWRFNLNTRQDDVSSNSQLSTAPVTSSRSESPLNTTPPEAWGGNSYLDRLAARQPASKSTHLPPSISLAFMTNSSFGSTTGASFNSESSTSFTESLPAFHSNALSATLGSKPPSSHSSLEMSGLVPSNLPRKYSTYAERISTAAVFSDSVSSALGSPKSKKTGAEPKDEVSSQLTKQEAPTLVGMMNHPALGVMASQRLQGAGKDADQLGTSAFPLLLAQSTIEEIVGSMQKAIHEDVRNLHIDVLRQFHMQETQMTEFKASVLGKLEELTKEVHFLRMENQQLRQLL